MTRVKRGAVARKKRKKILQISSGFRGSSSSLFRVANQHALKALKASYRDRHNKKRDFRSTWIARINAAVRGNSTEFASSAPSGMSETGQANPATKQNYNLFLSKLKSSSSALNRKVLATLAVKDQEAFLQVQIYANTVV